LAWAPNESLRAAGTACSRSDFTCACYIPKCWAFRVSRECAHALFTDALAQTVASDGFRGVYRGFDIALVGVVAWRAFYFGGYEAATAKLLGDRRNGTLAQRWVLAQAVTTASGTLIYPLDSVRRRMMMQSGRKDHLYSSSVDCFRKVFAQEGIAGFYRGISANILRGFGGALMLVLVDEIGSALRGATGLPVLGRPDR
jgi:solute carrier family 25 (adenine nucleotide translocator) protein 4/5/6/31